MRVRVVLGVALVLAAGVFILDMSGRAPRIAGTDHTSPTGFVASVPSHGVLCQTSMVLPYDARSIEVLVGTYGHPVPRLTASFTDARNQTITTGELVAGAHEGYVQIPLGYPHGRTVGGTLCVHFGRAVRAVVLGGEVFTPGSLSAQVDGKPQEGRIDVVYKRPGRESWWQLLGTLDERFGVGKATFFGGWSLPAMALLLLAVWIGVIRLLVRELT